MPDTVRTILQEALEELGVQAPGESLPPERADWALVRYNRWLDAQNAKRETVYADQFLPYTLTPTLSPHTIGPTGATWTVTQRPVSIEGASLFLGSTPDVKTPITPRDKQWWNDQRVPALSTSWPTDLYYDPTWPNGSLYFWPVPSAAYVVELWTRIVLAQVTLATTFTLPPGYRRAHVLSLAEECAEGLGQEISPRLERAASQARALVAGNNRLTPRLVTADAGMPKGAGGGTRSFNWLTREGT